MSKNKKKSSLLIYILTPVIILLICSAVIVIGSIVPYKKASVYLNLAFMDSFQHGAADENSGLIIQENNINLKYSGETSSTGEIIRPAFGEQFAVLSANALEINVPVYWGTGQELFSRGACQATYSKLPGETGNSVISAHTDTFFDKLKDVKTGETVTVYTKYGEFQYKVTELISFNKTDKKYVSSTDEARLTLYTCKKDILGASGERIGVICEPVSQKFYVQAEEEKN
ncbi:MAG: class D sortase [Oscillospiraceae bacterium]|nr:class D sortase [Oscillospiraceae bacterium]